MRTERQREAARINGAKSRGPRTPEGKSKSSANSLRHGRYSSRNSPENDAHVVELHAALAQVSAPSGPRDESPAAIEAHLAEVQLWSWARLTAVRAFESRLFSSEVGRLRQLGDESEPAHLIYRAVQRLCDETSILDIVSRLEEVLCQQWERAAERLCHFRKAQAEIARCAKMIATERTRQPAAVAHPKKITRRNEPGEPILVILYSPIRDAAACSGAP